MKRLLGLLMPLTLVALGCGTGAKVWTQKYDDVTVQEEYQYYHEPESNRRVKHGWYNSYHPNGAYSLSPRSCMRKLGTTASTCMHAENATGPMAQCGMMCM